MPDRISPSSALARHAEGNARFVHELAGERAAESATRAVRARLATRQEPFATVVSCSDSRVPAEIVFDQGLGDLFIVRNAGGVIGHAPLASIEFGVVKLGTPLVLALQHQGCGAFRAAIEAFDEIAPAGSPSLQTLVRRLVPALVAAGPEGSLEERCERAARLHAERVARLIARSPVIAPLVAEGAVHVVPAYYHLAEGVVDVGKPVAAGEAAR
jgi:carbonic anhydrase